MADRVFVVKVSEAKNLPGPDGVAVVIRDSVIAYHILERPRTVHDYAGAIRNGGSAGAIRSDLVVDYLLSLSVATSTCRRCIARDQIIFDPVVASFRARSSKTAD